MITEETRRESFEQIKPKRPVRYDQIIYVLKNNPNGLSAKEIAVELHNLKLIESSERNYVSPRLTELVKKEKVKVVDWKKCKYTNRKVAVYQLI